MKTSAIPSRTMPRPSGSCERRDSTRTASEPAVLEGSNLRDFLDEYDILDKYYDSSTPMIYFSHKGDLPMCRYLLVHGTRNDLTRKCSKGLWFPMYAAAYEGHLDVCQWLYDRGAVGDVYRKDNGWTPLMTSWRQGHVSVLKWLILNGALHGEPGEEFSISDAKSFVSHISTAKRKGCQLSPGDLIFWAFGTNASHEAFRVFLMGTLPLCADNCIATLQSILTRNLYSEKAAQLIVDKTAPGDRMVLLHELSSPLHVLGGFPEILELVADFVGIVKQRRAWDRLRDLAAYFAEASPQECGEGENNDGNEHLFGLEDASADEDNSDDLSSSS